MKSAYNYEMAGLFCLEVQANVMSVLEARVQLLCACPIRS